MRGRRASEGSRGWQPPSRRWGFAIAATLHAAALAALLTYVPPRKAALPAPPIMVSLVTEAPALTPKEPPKVLPKPLPVKARPRTPERPPEVPVVVARTEAPAAMQELPAPEVAKPPSAIEAAPSLAAPSLAPPAPAPVVPPVFNAAYLDNPTPTYPPQARRAHEQGKILLRVLVNVRGGADSVEVKNSSGSAHLDAAALDTVKRWRFVPARQGDQAVAAWVLIPITFTLAT